MENVIENYFLDQNRTKFMLPLKFKCDELSDHLNKTTTIYGQYICLPRHRNGLTQRWDPLHLAEFDAPWRHHPPIFW